MVVLSETVTTAQLLVGDRFEARLPVQQGWGGRWILTTLPSEIVRLIEELVKPAGSYVDDGGLETQVFVFKAIAPGAGQIVLEERRPFQPDEPPRNKVTYSVIAR
jgi:hypothetical protein